MRRHQWPTVLPGHDGEKTSVKWLARNPLVPLGAWSGHCKVRAQQTFLPKSRRDVDGGLYGEGAFPEPCTPRIPSMTAAASWACQWQPQPVLLALPLLDSTNILVSISELRNPRMPPWTHCGCTSGAIQGKRGSRSRSCRQLLPPPRLNKGQPSSQIPEIETREIYPFSLDRSLGRVLCTAQCAKPASLR